jgi:hypothetical protein
MPGPALPARLLSATTSPLRPNGQRVRFRGWWGRGFTRNADRAGRRGHDPRCDPSAGSHRPRAARARGEHSGPRLLLLFSRDARTPLNFQLIESMPLNEWVRVAFVASVASAATTIAASVDHADGTGSVTAPFPITAKMSPSSPASLSVQVGIVLGQRTPDVLIDDVSLSLPSGDQVLKAARDESGSDSTWNRT